jgi:hypothetical protein
MGMAAIASGCVGQAGAQGEPAPQAGGSGVTVGVLPSYESEAPGGVSRIPHLAAPAAAVPTTGTTAPGLAGGSSSGVGGGAAGGPAGPAGPQAAAAAPPGAPAAVPAAGSAQPAGKTPPTQTASAPGAAPSAVGAGVQPPYDLRITATARQVWVWIAVDGGAKQAKSLNRGQSADFKANERFDLSTDHAGGIRATLNGKELPPFGGPTETKKNIVIPSPEASPVG